jgi:hypothetical protein
VTAATLNQYTVPGVRLVTVYVVAVVPVFAARIVKLL